VRLVVLCPHFEPDLAPTGVVMTSIVRELAARDHQVHVVTSLPWYEHHTVEPAWRHPGADRLVHHTDVSWGRISRVHPFPTEKTNIPARAVAFGAFTALNAATALVSRSRPDVVLAMSPPLTLGPAGWAVAQAHGAPFVFNIQDVFPDVAVEVGAITNPRVIAAASWLEQATYRAADAITVLSDDLRDNVTAKLRGRAAADADKVRVIPNFVDTERIRPGPKENSYRAEYGLSGKTVVMYAGNLGYSQSVDLLLDAAVAHQHDPSIVFVVNGGGSARPELEREASGLENVRFVGLQPRDRLGEVLAAADVHVVPLRKGLARSSVPSKLYSVLASGRPVVASVDPGTEVARTVTRAGAGLAVPPDDAEAFTKAITRMVEDPEQAARWGAAGRAFVESWASPAAVAASYEALFEELRDRSAGAGRSREGRAGR
jgi:colanic acid biosynthesis glycosyl transferase WcaI